MDITSKLQIKPGQRVATVAGAGDVPAIAGADPAIAPADAEAVVAFVRSRAELEAIAAPAIEAAQAGRLAWIAYPKAGKLGTDLNRDILAGLLTSQDIQPVRQVAIDDVWSALRFRPALPGGPLATIRVAGTRPCRAAPGQENWVRGRSCSSPSR